jgi:hypothetical protein
MEGSLGSASDWNNMGVGSRNDKSTWKLECVLVVEMALCRHVFL